MTPEEAKMKYRATHYSIMTDGVTPQLYYRQNELKFSDGTSKTVWEYLSFADIWMGSELTRNPEGEAVLKEIK